MNDRFDYQSGSYSTGNRGISKFAKRAPSLAFYLRVIRIVFQASSKAKKGIYDNDAWLDSGFQTLKSLEKVGVKFELEGIDFNLKFQEPCVLIANHMSVLETFVLPVVAIPHGEVTFVVKESLIRTPVFKHIMISRNPIVVGRENPRQDLTTVLTEGVAKLNQGISVIVFPQRTRTIDFVPEDFNSIGVKLAKRAGVKAVPIAVKTDAWGQGRIVKDFGKISPDKTVHISIGKPIEIKNRGVEEHEEIIQFIASRLKTWKTENES